MSLRSKIMIIMCATLISLIAVIYTIGQTIILKSFTELEKTIVHRNVERVLNVLADELIYLDRITVDWAAWDDTYVFIEDVNDNYVRSNLVDSTFTDLNINVMLFIDSSGRIVFGKGFDFRNGKEMPVPKSLLTHVSKAALLHHQDTKSRITGILLLSEGPMLIASRPILTSEEKGPIRGTLVMGRYLDSVEVEHLAKKTHLSITVRRFDDLKMPHDFRVARSSLSEEEPIFIRALSERSIAGYAMLKDIYGKPVLVLKVDMPRAIYKQGQASVHYFLLSLIVIGLIFSVISLLFLEKMILPRLFYLSASVNSIGSNSNFSGRVKMSGNDELSEVAFGINRMLEALEQSQSNLQKSKEHYRNLAKKLSAANKQLQDIIDFLPDPTFVIDSDKKVIAWNRAIEEMTGVRKEDIIGKGDYAYAVPFYGKPRPVLIDLIYSDDRETELQYEYVERKENVLYAETFAESLYDGKGAFLWIKASPLYNSEGKMIGAIESIRDISERKRAEKKLKYLSMHDQLTGIYNRSYFEQEMCRLGSEHNNPIGIIVCDVDGLKFVNDTLGHAAGDALLVKAADVIRKSIRKGDLVARIGGDEFAVLLPNTGETDVKNICRRIRNAVESYNASNPKLPLNISVGYAVSSGTSADIRKLLKEADNNMYREKLRRSRGTRSSIIKAMMKALETRDFIAEGHAVRLQKLAAGMAVAIGLSEDKITDLRLLARFHDIGKVGVPDRILFKEGALTPEEISEMQLHCEIGYRIAMSVADLVPIADWILKHHEWWNGKGYPLGLKGEEISLECRILAIADAYDAMTNDRPYRKAMSYEEALAELRRGAGTQFDPNLVQLFIQMLEKKS